MERASTPSQPAKNLIAPEQRDEVPLVRCEELVQEFEVRHGRARKGTVSALAGVSFEVRTGETLAVVGETGSGKSTLARALIGAPTVKRGRVIIDGHEVLDVRRAARQRRAQRAQMVFQNPAAALDPTWTVERSLSEPLRSLPAYGDRFARRLRVAEMLAMVGLPAGRFAGRRPHELSGGQLQRVAIARALVAAPSLVIYDEPVTALDLSIQVQILALLKRLREQLGLTYVLIAHDLGVVRNLADRIATMYLGRFCELGDAEAILERPAHPYTVALLSAMPAGLGATVAPTVPARIRLAGEPPSPLDPPKGCRFRTRCPYAREPCAREVPTLRRLEPGHEVACHFPLGVGREPRA